MENEILELHSIIRGQVQGVFFRATAREFANRIGVTGTARNLEDGSVEIYAQGTAEQLVRFIKDIEERYGETYITHMDKQYYKPTATFSDFQIVH